MLVYLSSWASGSFIATGFVFSFSLSCFLVSSSHTYLNKGISLKEKKCKYLIVSMPARLNCDGWKSSGCWNTTCINTRTILSLALLSKITFCLALVEAVCRFITCACDVRCPWSPFSSVMMVFLSIGTHVTSPVKLWAHILFLQIKAVSLFIYFPPNCLFGPQTFNCHPSSLLALAR